MIGKFLQKINFKNLFTKTILFLLVFVLVFGVYFSFPVQKARATMILDEIIWTFDFAAEFLMEEMLNAILDKMTDELVVYIQGGGVPKFIDNTEKFLAETADESFGLLLDEIGGESFKDAICNPDWAPRLVISLKTPKSLYKKSECSFTGATTAWKKFVGDFNEGGWNSFIQITEGKNNPYGTYLRLMSEKQERTLSAVAGKKMEGQFSGGFLGDKMCLEAVTVDDVTGVVDTVKIPLNQPEGVSKTQLADYAKANPGISYKCTQWRTRTPGTIAAEAFSKSVFKDLLKLEKPGPWEQRLARIFDAGFNRIVNDLYKTIAYRKPSGIFSFLVGNNEVNFAGSSIQNMDIGGDYDDETYNTSGYSYSFGSSNDSADSASVLFGGHATELVYYDPWSVQIKAKEGFSEDVDIWFTLDGHSFPDPSYNSPNIYSFYGSPTPPINITEKTKIRWISVDKKGIKEEVQTKTLSPLFSPPYSNLSYDLKNPTTVAVALDSTHIALVSDNPLAKIYHTVSPNANGPDPVSGDINDLYIGVIEIPDDTSKTIKWFGVVTPPGLGIIKYTEQIHTLTVKAPFPNSDVPMIADLSTITPLDLTSPIEAGKWPPVIGIEFPLQVYAGVEFTLDPSASHAYDAGDKIVKYEWDLGVPFVPASDIYDWKVEDANGDGVFENPVCLLNSLMECTSISLGSGFGSMGYDPDVPGKIDVTYVMPGEKTLTLRITDNNGVTQTQTIIVRVTN